MSVLLYRKRYNAAKIEATPGTAEVLANGDAAENFFNPTFEPDIPAFEREGQLSASPMSSVPGARSAKCSVTTHAYNSGNATVPYWASVLLLACGVTGTSNTFTPITGGTTTLTAQLAIHNNTYTVAGAQGNLKMSGDKVGEPIKLNWEYTGLYVNPGTASTLTPTFPTAQPPRFAGATLTLASNSYVVRKFEFDQGNKVVLREDAVEATGAGYIGSVITERNPKITLTIEAPLTSSHDFYADQRNATEAAFVLNIGSGSNGVVTLNAPKAQIRTAPKIVNNDGILCYDLELGLNRNSSAGDDEYSIVFS